MKILTKYTAVVGILFAAALSYVTFSRVTHLRGELEDDMRRDHQMVGRVLEAAIAAAPLDAADLIRRANAIDSATRLDWEPATRTALPSQAIEGGELVSRFPVRAGGAVVGTIVARESLADVDRVVRVHTLLGVAGIASILLIGVCASLVLGRWLIGRPIALLVQQARRIGRREPATELAFRRSDELGELAIEMSAASQALTEAVEQTRHSDRLSTVGKLAAGIAHELGTPLSIVAGHAQMIAGREVTGDAALESARAIDREVTRIGRIVRQLLDFARRKGPEGTTCEPGDVARRCVQLLTPMAEHDGVHCAIREATPPPRALIDEDSLQQVLTNLIVNAFQAMPSGGELTVVASRADEHVRVDVRDSGSGIAESVRERMFEPFVTTKQPGEGTGLGLAVVYGIVADHGGWITVDTSERGTTFSVFLQEAA